MLEITNHTKSPVQILIKSKQGAYINKQGKCMDTNYAFKSLNIPGIGSGKNIVLIEDEKATDHIQKLQKHNLIKIRHI